MRSLELLPLAKSRGLSVREIESERIPLSPGSKASAIFEVEQVRLRLMRYAIDNNSVVLHAARKGDLFAEAALFAGTYSSTRRR